MHQVFYTVRDGIIYWREIQETAIQLNTKYTLGKINIVLKELKCMIISDIQIDIILVQIVDSKIEDILSELTNWTITDSAENFAAELITHFTLKNKEKPKPKQTDQVWSNGWYENHYTFEIMAVLDNKPFIIINPYRQTITKENEIKKVESKEWKKIPKTWFSLEQYLRT